MIVIVMLMLLMMIVVLAMRVGRGVTTGLGSINTSSIRIGEIDIRHNSPPLPLTLRRASLQVSAQNVDQLLGRHGSFRPGILIRVHYMESDMPVEHLCHQGIERATASGDGVQDFRAIGFTLDGILDGFNLALDPADPVEQFLLIPNNVSHCLLQH
jgi:hypothetical protein